MITTQPILRGIVLAITTMAMAIAANGVELIRGAVSGGVASATDGSVVLQGTVAEAGVVGRASDGVHELLEGFWFPPMALLGIDIPTGALVPRTPEVRRAMPNPFQAATVIPYGVSAPASVRMSVYDVGGRVVRSLVDADHAAGWFTASWDGRDTGGRAVASGVYYVATQIGSWRSTTKVIVTR